MSAPLLIEKLFDTHHEKALAPETALESINKFAPEPVSAEDVYIGRAVLANDRYDRSHERFTPEILNRFAETIVGKSVLPGHDRKAVPLGRWFGASVRANADGSHDLVADFYLRAKSEIADLVRTGIAQHVSVGFSADQRTCDLDGSDYDRCKKHKAGSTYDGKLATVTYGGNIANYEAREGSFVWLGCQYGAQVEGAKDAFDAHSGHVMWKSADAEDPDVDPGDDGMTEQEKADFDARADEVKALKVENETLKTKAAAGEAYLESLRGEIKRKADVLKENSAMYAQLMANADLELLKSWDADLQKRFDEKIPPTPQSQMLGHGAKLATDDNQPVASGRFPRLAFGSKAQGG
jgi:hypothetical protein